MSSLLGLENLFLSTWPPLPRWRKSVGMGRKQWGAHVPDCVRAWGGGRGGESAESHSVIALLCLIGDILSFLLPQYSIQYRSYQTNKREHRT